jgi:hypothetical protein
MCEDFTDQIVVVDQLFDFFGGCSVVIWLQHEAQQLRSCKYEISQVAKYA